MGHVCGPQWLLSAQVCAWGSLWGRARLWRSRASRRGQQTPLYQQGCQVQSIRDARAWIALRSLDVSAGSLAAWHGSSGPVTTRGVGVDGPPARIDVLAPAHPATRQLALQYWYHASRAC